MEAESHSEEVKIEGRIEEVQTKGAGVTSMEVSFNQYTAADQHSTPGVWTARREKIGYVDRSGAEEFVLLVVEAHLH